MENTRKVRNATGLLSGGGRTIRTIQAKCQRNDRARRTIEPWAMILMATPFLGHDDRQHQVHDTTEGETGGESRRSTIASGHRKQFVDGDEAHGAGGGAHEYRVE